MKIINKALLLCFLVISSQACNSGKAEDSEPSRPDNYFPLSPLRGAMCGSSFAEQNFIDLKALGANQVRWHLSFTWTADVNMEDLYLEREDYLAWLDDAMEEAELAADACERHGMLMVLDMASPPGGRNSWQDFRMFRNEDYADLFLESWQIIAERFKDVDSIYAFELVNEPVIPWDMEISVWNDLFLEAVSLIRAIDPDRTVIYDLTLGGHVSGFIGLSPLPIENIIYSFHVYDPLSFTHQGLFSYENSIDYPGSITSLQPREIQALQYSGINPGESYYWDKQTLRAVLQPAVDFQEKYQVPIWIGEFSAVRWSSNNSTYRYLKDCMELFEEYGWDWSYHCFRTGADMWSVEHTTDRDLFWYIPDEPTDREQLLESYFKLNEQL